MLKTVIHPACKAGLDFTHAKCYLFPIVMLRKIDKVAALISIWLIALALLLLGLLGGIINAGGWVSLSGLILALALASLPGVPAGAALLLKGTVLESLNLINSFSGAEVLQLSS